MEPKPMEPEVYPGNQEDFAMEPGSEHWQPSLGNHGIKSGEAGSEYRQPVIFSRQP